MCVDPIAIASGGVKSVGGLGGGILKSQDQAKKAHKLQREAEKNYKRLMDAYTQESTEQADASMRMFSTRDKQRVLARSRAGTLYTSPFGTQTTPYGKQSLLGA